VRTIAKRTGRTKLIPRVAMETSEAESRYAARSRSR
jgi:hypothetical protein